MNRILNDRETNTILHALRSMAENSRDDIKDACVPPACDHFAEADPLSSDEIDELCETIGLRSLTLDLTDFVTAARCQNCRKLWQDFELLEMKHLAERVAPGEPMPSGECPNCGAVCHPYTPPA